MLRIFLGMALAAASLAVLLTFWVSLYRAKKAQRLAKEQERQKREDAKAQEREKKEFLGDALYAASRKMTIAVYYIRSYCGSGAFGEWESIRASLLQICGTLDHINQFVSAHPRQAGAMHDVTQHLLPLVGKMMDEYDLCAAPGPENAAAKENIKIIDACLREVAAALDKKLSALFEGRAYDLQAELRVLESQKEGDWKIEP